MERAGFLLKVRQDKIDEYKEKHKEVWPDMLEALSRNGWKNYSLFLADDGQLFGYVEAEDTIKKSLDGMANEDVNMRWQEFMKVQVPISMPYLFSGLRVAIAVSVIGAVIGEWVGSSEGLGYLMIRSKPQFQTERVFAAIAILSAMGVWLFSLVGAMERIAIPWWHKERENRTSK